MTPKQPAERRKFPEIQPVDPERFNAAFEVAQKAQRHELELRDPTTLRFKLEGEDGHVQTFGFTDSPYYRVVMGVLHYLEPAPSDDELVAIGMRIFALARALRSEDVLLNGWVERRDDGVYIHSSLVEAAAKTPLNEHGDFEIAELAAQAILNNGGKFPDPAEE